MGYDVIVIGGGLAGLTAASLLAKRHLKVAVIEKSYNPGGSCGVFKRGHVTFDQGSAMLYGFGEKGFNAHRFVFNCLEEPIDIIRHDLLYCVNYEGKRIRFWPDVEKFADELAQVFPQERDNIRRFYRDMLRMYQHVMVETPSYTSADETDGKAALKSMLKHPVSYVRFLGYLNKSAKSLLEQYFGDPEIFKFFDKLTSTYCYATVEEAPAVLAAVMFVDNHVGGSYYPAGSTLFLPGKLEKVIEENGGDMLLEREAVSLIFEGGKPAGVRLLCGDEVKAPIIIYSGTVWNLYDKLIDPKYTTLKRRAWAKRQVPTYPSVVLYTVVDKNIIPDDTAPIEMLVGNPEKLDESEVTAYILSIDDRTLCAQDEHTVIAIGPTFEKWDRSDKTVYRSQKQKEQARLISVLERRFPGFGSAVRYAQVATPCTIERHTMKNGGAVAGPKQMLGQHMFKRLHIRTRWDNLFCCGESTVMGTGTPTVTTSGLTAANAVLKKLGKETFVYREKMTDYVRLVDKPFTRGRLYETYAKKEQQMMRQALRCRLCEHPSCARSEENDIRGIMRRVAVGNFAGAQKCWLKNPVDPLRLEKYESNCVYSLEKEEAIPIREIISFITGTSTSME
ncbi:MAG: FAD-dependent oxidoreductase [Eubacteriales bacterium]|jgi:prolycopene isomerase|nr:FAD-dependent oxidoreductase [Eubacteriales bacterium]MDD4710241.1 FAD-dependent oxidoreductase [Eubacteriales bacterium]NLO15158.1 FAD-dependent oxidoreductase [Clostridiales bacterium]